MKLGALLFRTLVGVSATLVVNKRACSLNRRALAFTFTPTDHVDDELSTSYWDPDWRRLANPAKGDKILIFINQGERTFKPGCDKALTRKGKEQVKACASYVFNYLHFTINTTITRVPPLSKIHYAPEAQETAYHWLRQYQFEVDHDDIYRHRNHEFYQVNGPISKLPSDYLIEGKPVNGTPLVPGMRVDPSVNTTQHLLDAFSHLSLASDSGCKGSTEVIICHEDNIKYFFMKLMQFPIDAWPRIKYHNCGITILRVNQNQNTVSCWCVNNADYLPVKLQTT